ncbi:MAG: 3-dehydroquinate synthase family protein [Bacteroidia bacterium]|nr:3-dehydroquinate synthase family protein [Bacteroidia bacterium]
MNGIEIYAREDFSGLGALIREERQVFLVYDKNVKWAAHSILEAGGITASMAIEASEAVKTLDTVLGICRFLLENNADRGALVLSLGGGVTTDMAGFAALIFKRGIRYANLPTTLLSQVDAGIGGKTGVNLDGYKNILGCIHQPEFVYIARNTLDTLPENEYRSGIAEMLKTFIIADAPHYRRAMGFVRGGRLLEDWSGNAVADEQPETQKWVDSELITAAARIKSGIVERDEFETGERRVLNLGHTIGHAIEWWQSQPDANATRTYSHGEAVAIGTIASAKLSEVLGVCEKGLPAQLEADFKKLGLPTECPAPLSAIEKAISRDKKAEGSSIHFVLIKEIGRVEVRLMPVERIVSLLDIANI